MFKEIFSKRNLFIAGGLIFTFSLIGFVEKKTSEKRINRIVVDIDKKHGNYFLDETDVINLMSLNNADSLNGSGYNEIDLKIIERRLKANKYINDAQAYKDYKGRLIVEVKPSKPVARIIQDDGLQAYLVANGGLLPLSEKFTSRVMVITGAGAKLLMDSSYINKEDGKSFLKFMSLIDSDPFLKAQIAEINFKNNGEMDLYTQVGNEVVEFGTTEGMEAKFKNFKIYYKKVLPLKGYNIYKRVNLKFKDQIICE